MICPRCGEANVGIKYPDQCTVEIRCYCGLHYLYLYKGTWEDSKQRMARMENKFICVKCKKTCITYTTTSDGNPRTKCDGCLYKDQQAHRVWIPKERGESKSPWKRNFVIMKNK